MALGGSAVLLAAGPPSLAWQLLALLAAMLTTGLSHGAVDHLVAARFLRARGFWFYAPYLAVGAGTAGLWWVSEPVALAVFLLLSVWHFGEGDLRDQPIPAVGRVAVSMTRGVLVVGTLFTAWPEAVVELLGPSLWAIPTFERSAWIPITLYGLHLGALAGASRAWSGRLETAAVDAACLAVWLWSAPPILAFAGYFGAWHSLAHIDTLQTRLTGRSLLYHALPLTLVAAFGGGLALMAVGHWADSRPVAAMVLPVLAALATPHILMVEVWRQTDPNELASVPSGSPSR